MGFLTGMQGGLTYTRPRGLGTGEEKKGGLQSQTLCQAMRFSLLVQFGARDLHLLGAELTVNFHEGAKLFGRVAYRLKTQGL